MHTLTISSFVNSFDDDDNDDDDITKAKVRITFHRGERKKKKKYENEQQCYTHFIVLTIFYIPIHVLYVCII